VSKSGDSLTKQQHGRLFDKSIEITPPAFTYRTLDQLEARMDRLERDRPANAGRYRNLFVVLSQENLHSEDDEAIVNTSHLDLSAVRGSMRDHRPLPLFFQVYTNDKSERSIFNFAQDSSRVKLEGTQNERALFKQNFLMEPDLFRALPRLCWLNCDQAIASINQLLREVAVKADILSQTFALSDLESHEQSRIKVECSPYLKNSNWRETLIDFCEGRLARANIPKIFTWLANGFSETSTPSQRSFIDEPNDKPAKPVSVRVPSPAKQHLDDLLKRGKITLEQHEALLATIKE
jgi:hypothetical protein